LGHALDHQNAWHDGFLGEMALEMGFVNADVFDAAGAMGGLNKQNTIHHQKGVAMGDQLTNIFNIQIVNHSVICFHVSTKFFHPSHGRAKRIPILVMHSITDYPKMTKEFVSEIQGKTKEALKGI
jgi:hypothetical protein